MTTTLSHVLNAACAGGAAWLMLRAGITKKALRAKIDRRCAACGRQMSAGPCPCTRNPS